jgi:tetratricopeptide (TPR) repeat protein
MLPHAAYFAAPELAPARHLQRAGQWNSALAIVPDTPEGRLLRAEILVDRQFWRLDPVQDALAAVDAIRSAHPEAGDFLTGQLEYWRRLQRPDEPAIAGDPVDTFRTLEADRRFGGWSGFWYGVALELLDRDATGAAAAYTQALKEAVTRRDLLLESYAVRHLGALAYGAGQTDRAIELLERSYDLRASLGARPQIAAAQAALADALGDSQRVAQLRLAVSTTAQELGLTWLK